MPAGIGETGLVAKVTMKSDRRRSGIASCERELIAEVQEKRDAAEGSREFAYQNMWNL